MPQDLHFQEADPQSKAAQVLRPLLRGDSDCAGGLVHTKLGCEHGVALPQKKIIVSMRDVHGRLHMSCVCVCLCIALHLSVLSGVMRGCTWSEFGVFVWAQHLCSRTVEGQNRAPLVCVCVFAGLLFCDVCDTFHFLCGFPPFTPAFNIVGMLCFCFLLSASPSCSALRAHTHLCSERVFIGLNIESGGVRGREQVVHYFVRQPLALEMCC